MGLDDFAGFKFDLCRSLYAVRHGKSRGRLPGCPVKLGWLTNCYQPEPNHACTEIAMARIEIALRGARGRRSFI